MKNPEKLKELILENVDMGQVMKDYNTDFLMDPDLMDEVQLRCPFHGKDNKPSARFYKNTQSMFCWVCYKSWDVIQFVMEKEQIYYVRALLFIIDKYKLDDSLITEDPVLEPLTLATDKKVSEKSLQKKVLRNKIRGLRGKIVFEKYRALVCAYYMVMFKVHQGGDSLTDFKKLEDKLNSIKIG